MDDKNIFKRMLRAITDESIDRVERTFNMLATLGLVGLGLSVVIAAIFNNSIYNVIFIAGLWLLFFLIYVLSVAFRKTKLAINLFAIILTFIFMPVNFFQTGGFFAGAVSLFIFVMAFICLLVESRIKYFYLAANCIIMFLCCFFQYFNPEYDQNFTRDMLVSDTLVTMSILSVLLSIMILFQIKIFKAENEKSLNQKKEIEDLNLAQNRFFSSMSHEIRTPINTIIGLNEMIMRDESASEETAENARAMQSAGSMLLTLVNDILDLSKIDAGKMEIVPAPYDTGNMLSDLVNMIWFPAKKKGLDFHINVDGKIPARLIGDETRVKQILINILNNAVKYTHKGSVALSVQCEKPSSSENAVIMVYSVADTGTGIKQENIPHLFDVFKRVDIENTRYIEGTGLGLSIVKQLIELMDGTIEVNSVYTQGSTFIVKIPQEIEGGEQIDDATLRRKHSIKSEWGATMGFTAPGARILVVDDNEANLMVAEKLLRETQIKIDTAMSGAECLKKTRHDRYDVIFMDHLMPEMDGIQCLHEIRRQREGLNLITPVVVLTANAGSDMNQLYRREGFDGILLKPVTGRQLEAELLLHLKNDLVKSVAESTIKEAVVSPFHSGRHKISLMVATDGAADIPFELAKSTNVKILHASVETEGGDFIEGSEIDQDGLMRYFADSGKMATSVDHVEADYIAFFADCLAKAQHLLYIPVSATIVSHFDVASKVANSFASVTVFDSGHISSGLGIVVLKAAFLARQGMDEEKILEEIEGLKDRIQTSFIVDDMKYLLNNGRVSRLVWKVCSALSLHPIVLVKDGQMTVGSIKMGSQSVFWKKYLRWALRRPWSIDKSAAFVTYAGIEPHRLREIEKEIREKVAFEHIYFQPASVAISANCGPGTFGVVFVRKS